MRTRTFTTPPASSRATGPSRSAVRWRSGPWDQTPATCAVSSAADSTPPRCGSPRAPARAGASTWSSWPLALPPGGPRLRRVLRPHLRALGRVLRCAAGAQRPHGSHAGLHRGRLHRPRAGRSSRRTRTGRSSATCPSPRRTRRGPCRTQYWQRFKDKPITQRATRPDQENLDETRCALAMLENQDWNVGRVLAQARRTGAGRQHHRALLLRQRPEQLALERRHEGPQGQHRRRRRALRVLPSLAGQAAGRSHGHADRRRDRSAAHAHRPGRRPARRRQAARRPRPFAAAARQADRLARPDDLLHLGRQRAACARTHRLDARGQLFDMVADPGQTTPDDRAAQPDAVAARLARASGGPGAGDDVRVRHGQAQRRAAGATRSTRARFRRLPRVPHHHAARTRRRAARRREAQQRRPNCSYFVNWTEPGRQHGLAAGRAHGRPLRSGRSTTPARCRTPARRSSCRSSDSRLGGQGHARLGSAAVHESGHASAPGRASRR